MAAALAEQLAAMPLQVSDEVNAFQTARVRASRMTAAPSSDSLDSSRFASKTIVTASFRFARASSGVLGKAEVAGLPHEPR